MDRAYLETEGFEGFHPVSRLKDALEAIPIAPGVYTVVTSDAFKPQFLERGTGGFHKGKDPNVPIPMLEERWVAGTSVLYFGKADAGRDGRRGLRKRIKEYLDFGAGRPVGHYGGRFIWQLQRNDELLLCWRELAESARETERRLIDDFVAAFGRRPFANLRG